MSEARVEPLGERALLIQCGDTIDIAVNARALAIAHAVTRAGLPGVLDIAPAYASVCLRYDPRAWADASDVDTPCVRLAAAVDAIVQSLVSADGAGSGEGDAPRWTGEATHAESRPSKQISTTTHDERALEIPVIYGGDSGPDLDAVAAHAGMSREAVIECHTAAEYRVAMLGFAPGYPYLLGLDPALHTPRRANPRTRVPAGSVAIGGAQTGIYPRELPGGWQIIGRTPLELFDAARAPPALLAPGQRVRFRQIPASAPENKTPASITTGQRARHDRARITVLSPGLLTTVQGGARHGFGALGVGGAGAMDEVSLQLANLLVGNARDAAALEITLRGPRLRFAHDALIAITGADVDARCNDEHVPHWRPVLLRAGSELNLGGMRCGTRAYLAVAAGIDLRAVLGSSSTDVNAALGPLQRPLAAGDELHCAEATHPLCGELWRACATHPCAGVAGQRHVVASRWSLDAAAWFDATAARPIRALAGSHFAHLDSASQRALFGATFRVGVDSNRVGCRLEGASLRLTAPIEMISAGVVPGTVQLPPGGVPIALTAEAPTSGGYPRIAQIVAVDLPHLAQRRPGDAVRFVQTDLADAQMRYLERERALATLEHHLRWRLREAW